MLNPDNPPNGSTSDRDTVAVSLRVRLLLFLLLACGLLATGLLSYQRLYKIPLPGCGAESDCERAAASDYALIFQVPVAYLGFAFCCALTVGWLDHGRRGLPRPLLWITRAGAVVSLIFLVLIVEHGLYCWYCLAAHLCNLAIWAISEAVARSSPWLRPSLLLGGSFLAVLLVFHLLKTHEDDAYHARRDAETEQIIDEIVHSQAGAGAQSWLPLPAPGGQRIGPDNARIRITVFFDYQCPYCQSLDRLLEQLCQHGDIAVTWRHYPASSRCNCHVGSDSHPIACRGARLAVAAAALAGPEGFLRVHRWLLDRHGRFTDEDVEQALPELHIGDPDAFWARVHAPQTRDAIQADIELAHELGADRTPAVFVNGVRLDSWDPAGAVLHLIAAMGEPVGE